MATLKYILTCKECSNYNKNICSIRNIKIDEDFFCADAIAKSQTKVLTEAEKRQIAIRCGRENID